MFYAINKDGVREDAYEAMINECYTCPVCGEEVLLKRGEVNVPHFAHKANVCNDRWNYDMSEWHKRMQNYFPKECQEVVVCYNGEKHRADVLIGDIVLEFQNSPITAEEFYKRNKFFKNAGYRLAWIFNFSEVDSNNLHVSDNREGMFIWKHPMRIFEELEEISEQDKQFALWFYKCSEDYLADGLEEYVNRIVWAIRGDDGKYSLRRFIESEYDITLKKDKINPEHFFYSKRDFFNEELECLKKKCSYNVKYKGIKGKPVASYCCPRTPGEFGIDIWGEKGCCYCSYCYMVAEIKRGQSTTYESYCCYPKRIRPVVEGDCDYECDQVPLLSK